MHKARCRKTGLLVAVKQYYLHHRYHEEPPEELIPPTRREIAVLVRLEHENIVRVYNVVVGPEMGKVFLCMEFVEKVSAVLLLLLLLFPWMDVVKGRGRERGRDGRMGWG